MALSAGTHQGGVACLCKLLGDANWTNVEEIPSAVDLWGTPVLLRKSAANQLRRFFDGDLEPQGLELPDMPTDAFGVAFVKIVSPEFVIRATVAHDVVRDRQDAVPHCDHRFLVACASPIFRSSAIHPRRRCYRRSNEDD